MVEPSALMRLGEATVLTRTTTVYVTLPDWWSYGGWFCMGIGVGIAIVFLCAIIKEGM